MSDHATSASERFLGRKLRQDIFSASGVVVLPAMTELRHEHMIKLSSLGIELSESDILPTKRETQRFLIEDTVIQVEGIFTEIRQTNKLPLQDIQDNIMPAIYEATEQDQLFSLFSSLQAKDDYTYRHNIGVGVIASLIGRWMQLPEDEMALLTRGATLHDVGKMLVSLDILNKPGRLTQEEFKLIQNHPAYGYEILKNTEGIHPREALIAYQHHERQDGTGYPLGLSSSQIDPLSKIVAVADVFHAMSSKRSYKDPFPFFEILRQMKRNTFGEFDPQVITVFMEKIMHSLIGNEVLLTDQRKGHVVYINPTDPINPLIQVEGQFIDLSRDGSVHIEKVLS